VQYIWIASIEFNCLQLKRLSLELSAVGIGIGIGIGIGVGIGGLVSKP
jgi:hypothetical protein